MASVLDLFKPRRCLRKVVVPAMGGGTIEYYTHERKVGAGGIYTYEGYPDGKPVSRPAVQQVKPVDLKKGDLVRLRDGKAAFQEYQVLDLLTVGGTVRYAQIKLRSRLKQSGDKSEFNVDVGSLEKLVPLPVGVKEDRQKLQSGGDAVPQVSIPTRQPVIDRDTRIEQLQATVDGYDADIQAGHERDVDLSNQAVRLASQRDIGYDAALAIITGK